MDFMHILGQKEAIWNTIYSIFERRHKRRGARENFPPSPSTGLLGWLPKIIPWTVFVQNWKIKSSRFGTEK